MATKIKTIKSDITFKKYVTNLKNKGYKQIGEGSFAVAYLHPGKRRVYKIGKLGMSDSYGNFAYLDFVKKILRDNTNPWFPKIYGVKIFKNIKHGKEETFYVVSMEKLNKIKGTREKSDMLEMLVEFHAVFGSIFKGTMPNKNIKWFVNAMRTLRILENNGYDLDIHNSNIMMRKGGQVVITDPVC